MVRRIAGRQHLDGPKLDVRRCDHRLDDFFQTPFNSLATISQRDRLEVRVTTDPRGIEHFGIDSAMLRQERAFAHEQRHSLSVNGLLDRTASVPCEKPRATIQ